MSTNSDPDHSDEQQDADAGPDDEADAAEQPSTADTASANASTEMTEEGTAPEAAPDADSTADAAPDAAASTSDSQATGPPTQFQAAITGGALKTALKTVSTLVDETRIHIDASGIQMRAVDPA